MHEFGAENQDEDVREVLLDVRRGEERVGLLVALHPASSTDDAREAVPEYIFREGVPTVVRVFRPSFSAKRLHNHLQRLDVSGTPPVMFQLMIRMGECTKVWKPLEVGTLSGEQRHYRW